MTPDARAFVVATFADNYRRHSGVFSDMAYKRGVVDLFEAAMPRLDVTVTTVPGQPDDFIGWSAKRGDMLVYVYVKKDYRRRGFGRALLPNPTGSVVYPTIDGRAFLRACGFFPRVLPYALFDVLEGR